MTEPPKGQAGCLRLADERATVAIGAALAELLPQRGLITLSGELGSGKTSLSRGLIRAAGHAGPVKSPTYTLVEPYELADRRILHFDLYRLEDPEELEFLGVREDLDGGALCLVEWPEKAAGFLPNADLALRLLHAGRGRELHWRAHSALGREVGAALLRRFPAARPLDDASA